MTPRTDTSPDSTPLQYAAFVAHQQRARLVNVLRRADEVNLCADDVHPAAQRAAPD